MGGQWATVHGEVAARNHVWRDVAPMTVQVRDPLHLPLTSILLHNIIRQAPKNNALRANWWPFAWLTLHSDALLGSSVLWSTSGVGLLSLEFVLALQKLHPMVPAGGESEEGRKGLLDTMLMIFFKVLSVCYL